MENVYRATSLFARRDEWLEGRQLCGCTVLVFLIWTFCRPRDWERRQLDFFQKGQEILSVVLLERKCNLPYEWIHPEHPDVVELAEESAQRKNILPVCYVRTREK